MYEYTPIDACGTPIVDECGTCARMRFTSREHAFGYAHAMSLRYPFYRIEKVSVFRRLRDAAS